MRVFASLVKFSSSRSTNGIIVTVSRALLWRSLRRTRVACFWFLFHRCWCRSDDLLFDDRLAFYLHNFGDPLWVRVLGIIYSHPQPKDGRTYIIENQDGLPMPTTFAGELASDYLIDSDEMETRRSAMMDTCGVCHSSAWVEGHFAEMDTAVSEADAMVLAATELLQKAWDAGIADDFNPFDETIEQMWIKQWLFYATSVRYVGAMGGSDYASFKNGWWELNRNLQEMKSYIDVRMGE